MKRLEDIPKKQVFIVPDGYFEKLPGKIQARISRQAAVPERSLFLRYKLQYAVPAVVVFLVALLWFSRPDATDVDSLLASVDTEDLVAYLAETELTTEDIVESVELDGEMLEGIEAEVYQLGIDSEDVDGLIDELDL